MNHLLLIQAPFFEDYGPMKKAAGTYFPLGLGYIAAAARAKGVQTTLLDPNVQSMSTRDIMDQVTRDVPLAIGISFMTPQFRIAKQLCKELKARCPQTPIFLGGAHPSVLPQETLAHIPEADVAIVGEGEETLLALLQALQAGSGFAPVEGICWRNNGEIVTNESRMPISDLDSLPFPDRSLIDQSLYHAQSFLSYSKNAGTVYTSRGCPGRCSFCCSGGVLRSKIRERSLDNIFAEIETLVKTTGMDYLLVKDDTFTLKKSRVKAFCAEMKNRFPQLKWHCMGRVDTTNVEMLAVMKEAGLHDIFLGLESGNDEILKRAQKGITTQRAREIVSACADLGIQTYGAFILGLPGDSRQTIEETIAFACSLPLTLAGFSVLIPYPGTQVYSEYYRSASAEQPDYSQFIASSGTHYVEDYTGLVDLTPAELPALVAQAQRRFYLRPRQILRLLRNANPSMIHGYFRGAWAMLSKELYLRKGER